MSNQPLRSNAPVRREFAGEYLLTFLVGFSVTVVATRVFLQLTGFPQIGNDTLHFAHALWGGLLLILATLLPLVLSNSWALMGSALLGGIGVGLFIDEVGKFITQSNDYFFGPALPLIYGFFLVVVVVYLLIRQAKPADPRRAIYQSLDALKEVIDHDLDSAERLRLEDRLAIAQQTEDRRVAELARALRSYLQEEETDLPSAEPDLWTRIRVRADGIALRLGRPRHRIVILGLLIAWSVLIFGSIALLAQSHPSVADQALHWRGVLMSIQVVIGAVVVLAMLIFLSKRERMALDFAIAGFLLSLIALQTTYFYISQFSAVTATLVQYLSLEVLLIYRRLYLASPAQHPEPVW